jgi:hypothetical protein
VALGTSYFFFNKESASNTVRTRGDVKGGRALKFHVLVLNEKLLLFAE